MVVDVQKNMFFGDWSVPQANQLLEAIEHRVDSARESKQLVVFVQNDGPAGEVDEPHSEGWELVIEPQPGELTVRKTSQNVFETNPNLAAQLRSAEITQLEFCGVQSELCMQASALGALAEGFQISVNRNLHGTFDGGWPGATGGPSATELSDSVQAALEVAAGDRWR